MRCRMKFWKQSLVIGAALCALGNAASAGPAWAGDAADRAALLERYAAQARAEDGAFTGFSAARGEAFFRKVWTGGDARTPACTACHGDDPRTVGRNAKTGRPIDPVAVSAQPDRFTDADRVEKQFRRDCGSVLNRACTAVEKGDYITFMMEQ